MRLARSLLVLCVAAAVSCGPKDENGDGVADGIVSPDSQKRSLDFLKQFDKEIAAATIDTAKTWDDRFVKKAATSVK